MASLLQLAMKLLLKSLALELELENIMKKEIKTLKRNSEVDIEPETSLHQTRTKRETAKRLKKKFT